MKKYFLILILFTANEVHSQNLTSYGFSSPSDIGPLLEYRLPTWSYSNWSVNLLSNGNIFIGDITDITIFDYKDYQYVFSLLPEYEFYRESESSVTNLNIRTSFIYDRDLLQNYPEYRHDRITITELNLDLTHRIFLFRDFFIEPSFDGTGRFDKNRIQRSLPERVYTEITNRYLRAEPGLAIGWGRVRDISPVIRALRLRERIQKLDRSRTLSNEQILSAAEHFTKFEGYRKTYDRPEKFFWDDFLMENNIDLISTDPFSVLYINDVLKEHIGKRFEGWDVLFRGSFTTEDLLVRDHNRVLNRMDRSINNSQKADLGIDLRYFKNSTLSDQSSIFVSSKRTIYLNDSNIDNITATRITGSQLYTLTDRIALTGVLSGSKSILNYSSSSNQQLKSLTINEATAAIHADYFVENFASFSATVGYTYSKYIPDSDSWNFLKDSSSVNFAVQLRYYLVRSLR